MHTYLLFYTSYTRDTQSNIKIIFLLSNSIDLSTGKKGFIFSAADEFRSLTNMCYKTHPKLCPMIITTYVLHFRLWGSNSRCCKFFTFCKNTHYRDLCKCNWLIWLNCWCLYGECLMHIISCY